jgi:hypothetical protein
LIVPHIFKISVNIMDFFNEISTHLVIEFKFIDRRRECNSFVTMIK